MVQTKSNHAHTKTEMFSKFVHHKKFEQIRASHTASLSEDKLCNRRSVSKPSSHLPQDLITREVLSPIFGVNACLFLLFQFHNLPPLSKCWYTLTGSQGILGWVLNPISGIMSSVD